MFLRYNLDQHIINQEEKQSFFIDFLTNRLFIMVSVNN